MSTTRPDPGTRRKVGRPAKLDRDLIARAAYEVGLDRLTMRAVAEHLGSSVPGLYHHVDGRDDLMRLAAEYSTAQIQVPVDRGQSWPEWLREWARYMYDALVTEPELLHQLVRGAISVDRMGVHLDAVMGLLARHGFTPAEARDAYGLVSSCAVGAAFGAIRDAEAARAGRPISAEYHRVLAAHGPEQLPHLRELAADRTPPAGLDDQITTVLVGIAVRRGAPFRSILEGAATTGADVVALHH